MPSSVPKKLIVGVPCYNAVDRIHLPLESLKKQVGDFHVVISDNGSADGTQDRVHSLIAGDNRFTLIAHPENQGPSFNFRFCLNWQDAEFFMWLADDDFISDGFIERALGYLETHPNIGWVTGDFIWMRYADPRQLTMVSTPRSQLSDDPFVRSSAVIGYMFDNSEFYGVYRQEEARRVMDTLPVVVGADWIFSANLAFLLKMAKLPELRMYRSMARSQENYFQRIAATTGAPAVHARRPHVATAMRHVLDVMLHCPIFRRLSVSCRARLADLLLGEYEATKDIADPPDLLGWVAEAYPDLDPVAVQRDLGQFLVDLAMAPGDGSVQDTNHRIGRLLKRLNLRLDWPLRVARSEIDRFAPGSLLRPLCVDEEGRSDPLVLDQFDRLDCETLIWILTCATAPGSVASAWRRARAGELIDQIGARYQGPVPTLQHKINRQHVGEILAAVRTARDVTLDADRVRATSDLLFLASFGFIPDRRPRPFPPSPATGRPAVGVVIDLDVDKADLEPVFLAASVAAAWPGLWIGLFSADRERLARTAGAFDRTGATVVALPAEVAKAAEEVRRAGLDLCLALHDVSAPTGFNAAITNFPVARLSASLWTSGSCGGGHWGGFVGAQHSAIAGAATDGIAEPRQIWAGAGLTIRREVLAGSLGGLNRIEPDRPTLCLPSGFDGLDPAIIGAIVAVARTIPDLCCLVPDAGDGREILARRHVQAMLAEHGIAPEVIVPCSQDEWRERQGVGRFDVMLATPERLPPEAAVGPLLQGIAVAVQPGSRLRGRRVAAFVQWIGGTLLDEPAKIEGWLRTHLQRSGAVPDRQHVRRQLERALPGPALEADIGDILRSLLDNPGPA